MRKLIASGLVVAGFALAVPAASFATDPHDGTTGQPSQACLSSTAPNEPGNASNAPGSAFNEPSDANPNGGTAGQVYAGNGHNTQTPANGHAVSQYDVACFQVSQH
jgi:hypothetical protein